MKHKLTEMEKILIIQNYDKMTLGRIGELLHLDRQTIYLFYKRWQSRQTIINRKPTGRKQILGKFWIYKFTFEFLNRIYKSKHGFKCLL